VGADEGSPPAAYKNTAGARRVQRKARLPPKKGYEKGEAGPPYRPKRLYERKGWFVLMLSLIKSIAEESQT